MGYMQVLLVLTSVMIFGAFNLFVQTTTLENMIIQAETIALQDMYEYGKNAQVHYDTTNSYIGFYLGEYQLVTPYATYNVSSIGSNEIVFDCNIFIDGRIYRGTLTRSNYSIIKIQ